MFSRSPASLADALRVELSDMRSQRLAQAAATKAARHAAALERAREIDRQRLARLDAAAKVQIGLAAATGVHAALSFAGYL